MTTRISVRAMRADSLARLLGQQDQVRTVAEARTAAVAAGWRRAHLEIALDDLHLDGRLAEILRRPA